MLRGVKDVFNNAEYLRQLEFYLLNANDDIEHVQRIMSAYLSEPRSNTDISAALADNKVSQCSQ